MNTYKIIRWPVTVLVLHAFATVSGLYWQISRLDNALHFLGGMSIAAASSALLQTKPLLSSGQRLPWLFRLLFCVGLVALAATSWELMEFLLDTYTSTVMQPSIADTMSDLALGLTGGFLVTLYNLRKNKPQ